MLEGTLISMANKPTELKRDEAIALVKKHGGIAAAAAAYGCNRSTVSRVINGHRSDFCAKGRAKGRSFSRDEFAASFDNDTRTRLALRGGVASLEDDDEILEDADFRASRCRQAHATSWRRIGEESEFAKHRFIVKGKVFWSTVATRKWALQTVEGATE
jgi:hypothetical protein